MFGAQPPLGGSAGPPSTVSVLPSGSDSGPEQGALQGSRPAWTAAQLALMGLPSVPSDSSPALTHADIQAISGEDRAAQQQSISFVDRRPVAPDGALQAPSGNLLRRTISWPASAQSDAYRRSPERSGAVSQQRRPFLGVRAPAGTAVQASVNIGSAVISSAVLVDSSPSGQHVTVGKQHTGNQETHLMAQQTA